ncbi:MAG: MFS transporter [Micropruina sp.]|uniref:MFS transporter n=1 Tax=Micropruina sp. TaxID=2737536 RepID=UPI0039E33AEA
MTLKEEAISAQDRIDAQSDPSELHKPLLDNKTILLMNLGFFGVNYAMGLQQTAISPLFAIIGANPEDLPLLNLAGPITGLVIQPIIGVLSDRTWTRWGRRKPFFVSGVVLAALMLFLFPFVSALWMAVLLLWLLDAGANTGMEPYRALISDKLRLSQRTTGYLLQGVLIGGGAVVANVSLFIFQQMITGTNAAGVPHWVPATFWVGAFFLLLSVAISAAKTKEIKPSDEEIAHIRSLPKHPGAVFGEIFHAVREMPLGMHKIGLVYAFQWYGLFVWWQFGSLIIGNSAFGVNTGVHGYNETPAYLEAVGWTGLINGWYALVAMGAAIVMIPLAKRFGAKNVHAVALLIAGVGLSFFPFVHDKYLMFIPMIGLGIAWASVCSLPFVMVTSMVPAARIGVYLGILNMMIVVPQLIETVTFGSIYAHLLGSDPTKAGVFIGVMFVLAGLAATWVNPPKASDESSLMPLGSPRRMTSVYNRVIVGSDGTPASLATVGHAAGIASAAEARLVVVSAFNADGAPSGQRPRGGDEHEELYGERAAQAAVERSVQELTKERFKLIERRIVAGTPAQALLEVAGDNPDNLIVVGNRGVGAADGEALGSIPREVVRNAVCNVMIVQTSPSGGSHRVVPGAASGG